MATTGHESEVVQVQGLKASLKKGGNKGIFNEAICSTAGATAAKVTNTTPPSFTLTSGATIIVKFTYAISVANATLKVGEADAKPIYYRGAALEANKIKAGDKVLLRYNGTQFDIVGSLGETYSTMGASGTNHASGLVPDTPSEAGTSKYLREDGTWVTPPNTEYEFNTAYDASTNKAATMSDLTKSNVGLGNVTNDAQVKASEKGAANGVAELDANGKVPSSQLPSYVDDVIEGYLYDGKFYKESTHTTEISGESGKIYTDLATDKTYRWSGSAFTQIKGDLALGETLSTAYRGDRGKIAYDHSQVISGNPHNVSKSDVGLGNVGNFKAVSTEASQGLSDTEKGNARANIGAGTSNFSGSYNDLSDKPTIPDAQIQSDWNQTDTSAKDFIKNKPDVATLDADGHVESEQLEAEYQELTAGNIVGEFSDEAQFAYRPTAGAVDIESGKADKGAKLVGIKGNTTAWNQLGDISHFQDETKNGVTLTNRGTYLEVIIPSGGISERIDFISAAGGKACVILAGHKKYHYAGIPQGAAFTVVNGTLAASDGKSITTQEETVNSVLMLALTPLIEPGTYHIYPTIIDLTLIYGEGNEPSTVEQFEADYLAWFGKLLTYEEYDEGSLRPVKMTGLKTVGFNAWDEQWVHGYVEKETGNIMPGHASTIASKNLIPVVHDATYYFMGYGYITMYDANQAVVDQVFKNNDTFDIGTNVRYIRFHSDSYGDTYNHDICINLSHSGARDGEYEPYWTSTVNFDVTKIYGKLNGSGDYVQVFPDGVKKVGTVADLVDLKNGVTNKKVGSVDLSTLTWHLTQSHTVFYADMPQDSAAVKSGGIKYALGKQRGHVFVNDNHASNDKKIHIVDGGFADSAEFYAFIQGVILFYELATPLTYTDLVYREDGTDFPVSEIIYDVDDYGTEEVLLGTNGVAPTLDIKYGINAPDTIKNLPHNFVSAVGEQNFTEAQKARARKNIGVIEQTQLDALTRHTRKTDFDLNVLKQAVADGNLEKYGLKVGDEKTINGHTYVIADLNPMKGTVTPYRLTTNHVGLIVIPHTTQAWNASGNTAQGADNRGAGYLNCDLHYYLKNTLLPLVETDLGANNLLGHSKLLSNAVTDGKASNWTWQANCKICALSEVQVYGSVVWGASGYDTGEACRQLAVFQKYSHTEIFGGEYIWLRDVVSAPDAARADANGYAYSSIASAAQHVAALILFH